MLDSDDEDEGGGGKEGGAGTAAQVGNGMEWSGCGGGDSSALCPWPSGAAKKHTHTTHPYLYKQEVEGLPFTLKRASTAGCPAAASSSLALTSPTASRASPRGRAGSGGGDDDDSDVDISRFIVRVACVCL